MAMEGTEDRDANHDALDRVAAPSQQDPSYPQSQDEYPTKIPEHGSNHGVQSAAFSRFAGDAPSSTNDAGTVRHRSTIPADHTCISPQQQQRGSSSSFSMVPSPTKSHPRQQPAASQSRRGGVVAPHTTAAVSANPMAHDRILRRARTASGFGNGGANRSPLAARRAIATQQQRAGGDHSPQPQPQSILSRAASHTPTLPGAYRSESLVTTATNSTYGKDQNSNNRNYEQSQYSMSSKEQASREFRVGQSARSDSAARFQQIGNMMRSEEYAMLDSRTKLFGMEGRSPQSPLETRSRESAHDSLLDVKQPGQLDSRATTKTDLGDLKGSQLKNGLVSSAESRHHKDGHNHDEFIMKKNKESSSLPISSDSSLIDPEHQPLPSWSASIPDDEATNTIRPGAVRVGSSFTPAPLDDDIELSRIGHSSRESNANSIGGLPTELLLDAELVPDQEETENRLKDKVEKEFQQIKAEQFQQHLVVSNAAIAQAIPHATPEENENDPTVQPPRRHFWMIISVILGVLVAVGIGVAVFLSRDDSGSKSQATDIADAADTQPPTKINTGSTTMPTLAPAPSSAPTYFIAQSDQFYALLEILQPALKGPPTVTDESDFVNPRSISYLVLDWMANNDTGTENILGGGWSTHEQRDRQLLERYCVATMYHKLNGPEWTEQYNFLSNSSICDWNEGRSYKGIICDTEMNFVTIISLANNNLAGAALPDELYHLRYLDSIVLSTNEIGGTISPFVGGLQSLRSFNVDRALLIGTLPTEIGQLASLQLLRVTGNGLFGTLPTEMGMMKVLTHLNLQLNSIVGAIPSEIGMLTDLRNIYLGNTYLSGTVPKELSNLTNLRNLELQMTEVTGNLDPIFCVGENQFEFLVNFVSPCLMSISQYGGPILSQTVCSCCTSCSDDTITSPEGPQPPECENSCVACDNNDYAPSCGACPVSNSTGVQLCSGSCSWNETMGSCETRTEFGL